MKTDPSTPCAWANVLVSMWGPRFPVDVRQIALEYSKRFADPVHDIAGAEMPGFEGALGPLRKRGGWAILYNPSVRSPGRINYTLGHELGHYLCHRQQQPAGFQCGDSDVLGATRLQEREADLFASFLLMPLDDFRHQVGKQKITLDLLRHCSDRYGVSFTAAALKWLESTRLCAAVVVATNGFVLWCRSSAAAKRARIYLPSGMELPAGSIAAGSDTFQPADGSNLPPGIWCRRPTREVAIFADHYEMTISLLVFEELGELPDGWDDEETEDAFDRFTRQI
jgi:hypothetical protein